MCDGNLMSYPWLFMTITGWWFGTCFYHPSWLIFFRGVETTNQIRLFQSKRLGVGFWFLNVSGIRVVNTTCWDPRRILPPESHVAILSLGAVEFDLGCWDCLWSWIMWISKYPNGNLGATSFGDVTGNYRWVNCTPFCIPSCKLVYDPRLRERERERDRLW